MIRLKNVSKFYYSKGMIASGISKVSLEFRIGEFVVITGESGSGKTTLLNVISGLDSYEEGEMYINGSQTSHYLASDFEEYRKKYIGNIFQNFNLVNSYTVYQNIELILLINGCSRREIKEKVSAIIRQVGLEEYSSTKVSKLSGGQKQRVAIARALAKDTDIIVADEPTGNLDSVSAEGIVNLLSRIAQQKLVIVVTHNYEQFEKHATRKIKMHDGSVAEDVALRKASAEEPDYSAMEEKACSRQGDITAGSKIRLGVRNTFNIFPKFILLLAVFLFVVLAVTSEYTSFRHQKDQEDSMGYNDYFLNYSEDRLILKKADGTAFAAEDFTALREADNIRAVSPNDILLDTSIFMENEDFSYEVYTKAIGEFEGRLVNGRMPEADNEVIVSAAKDELDGYMQDMILGKAFRIMIGEDKELSVTVVGVAYKPETENGMMMFTGEMYATDQMVAQMLKETYSYNSDVTVTINGKEQKYSQGNGLFRVLPSSKVSQGKAVVSEDVNGFYESGYAEGKTINVAAKNMYYSDSADVKISGIYTKKSFESKTGFSDYDTYNGGVFISNEDYNKLFARGNYQVTVYADDMERLDSTIENLEAMGYVTLPLKETLINFFSDLTSIVRVPMAVLLVLALFFIAYFVIRLIIKSRSVYFSILKMLGMAGKNIRRILDVELLLVVNIAYILFMAFIGLVHFGIIDVEYLTHLINYMEGFDYLILYMVMNIMAYLISGKFVRSLFKKTAMDTYREEG